MRLVPPAQSIRRSSRRCTTLAALALLAMVTSCGAGTAAVVGGGGGDSGGNGQSSISAFRVESGEAPPAQLRFVLSDPESDPASVQFFMSVDGAPATPLEALETKNPASFATSSSGIEYTIGWSFSDEPTLPDDASYEPNVLVYAVLAGSSGSVTLGSNAAQSGIGNDPPVASADILAGQELSAIVAVPIALEDSSGDVVSVRIEFDVVGDEPDAGWELARPAISDSTPLYALDGVIAPAGGVELGFFWDTNVDLFELERDVRLRITAVDPVAEGETFVTPIFRVDNNEAPLAEIRQEILLLSPDRRRGIPVPCIVRDPESDVVDLVFQWRRPGESFSELPNDPAAVRAIVADPALRQQFRVCTPAPTPYTGRAISVGASSLRMSEIDPYVNTVFDGELAGVEVEIWRASIHPSGVASSWPSNPLVRPIAAFPFGDGLRALVLDAPGSAGWRLSEIVLATGELTRTVATSDVGLPSALAREHGNASVLVASDTGGAWRIERVTLETGARVELIAAAVGQANGPLRGLASLGTGSALATASDVLLRLDWSEPATPRCIRWIEGLATPWGIALDPLNVNRAYVAERDANLGRVISVGLDDRSVRPVVAKHDAEPGLPRPEAIAIAHGGVRLLAITRPPGGSARELRGVELGGLGENEVTILRHTFAGQVGAIGIGDDQSCVVALSTLNDLAVGGGLEQRRTIVGFDPTLQVAQVDSPFAPQLSPLARWRVAHAVSAVRATPAGTPWSFLWDSSELAGAGAVFLKLSPYDSELGITDQTGAPKRLDVPLDGPVSYVGDPIVDDDPTMAAPADIDGDGDLDLAVACFHSDRTAVHFQQSPGVFTETPLALGNPNVSDGPHCVAVADLDSDGDLDVATACFHSDRLTIHFQVEAGGFAHAPLFVGNGSLTNGPRWVSAADLDGDGDQDLVVASNDGAGTGALTIFHQVAPGSFGLSQLFAAAARPPWMVATGDLDGDGDLDLVTANRSNGSAAGLTVFFQNAPGVFGAVPLSIFLPALPTFSNLVNAVCVADFDGDGDLDLAATRSFSDAVWVIFQVSQGVFDGQNALELSDPTRMLGPWGIRAADVDGDGDADIVSSNNQTHNLSAFHQLSPGVFASVPAVVEGNGPLVQENFVTSADFDGDGDLDLLTPEPAPDPLYEEITIIEHTGPGEFDTPPLDLSVVGPGIPISAAVTDLDGDCDLDVVSGLTNGVIGLYFQQAPGVFEIPSLSLDVSDVVVDVRSLVAADMDGDGDPDLVVAGPSQSVLAILFQDGSGAFHDDPLVLGPGAGSDGYSDVVAADLDGDGDLDLAAASATSGLIVLYFQTGVGAFITIPVRLAGPDGITELSASDLDGDGDLDLVAALGGTADRLSVSFQTAPGVFDAESLSVGNAMLSNEPQDVVVADLDGDGDQDLATSNRNTNGRASLTVFFQTQSGVFTNDASIEVGAVTDDFDSGVFGLQCLRTADLDADGDHDLIVGGANSEVHVFLQTAPGRFATHAREYGNNGFAHDIVVADVDGDGDLDLTYAHQANPASITIRWGAH